MRGLLKQLEEVGLKLEPNKVQLMADLLIYLGNKFTGESMSPTDTKVKALKMAKPPTSVSELHSFIGSATYLSRYIPGRAQTMAPLYALLKKSTPWK